MKTPTQSADVYAGMKMLPRAPDPRYNTRTESKHGVKLFGDGVEVRRLASPSTSYGISGAGRGSRVGVGVVGE